MRSSFSGRTVSRAMFALLVASAGVACSLVNAFDDVKPEVVANMPETGAPDAPVEAAVEAGTDAGANAGVIVVGGVAESDGGNVAVLTAISPATGAELPKAREKLLVAAVHYDGLRDLWYVFESNGATHFPTPTDAVFLHVKRLDTHTGAWQEVQSVKVPTLVANTQIVVLRDRLAYVAYHVEADSAVSKDLVVIDTTVESAPTVASTTALKGDPIGMIGTRSSSATAGGHVTLLFTAGAGATPEGGTCGGLGNCLLSQHVTVASEAAPAVDQMKERGVYSGSPAYGSFGASNGSPTDYIGIVPTPPNGRLQQYAANTGLAIGSPIAFQTNDPFLRPIAFADCLAQALLIGTNTETAVTSVPVGSAGLGDRGVMQHSGQSVHFEPYTSTVLAPFTQGEGYELTAFTLSGTTGAPKLTLRQAPEWTPPVGLRPEIVATRIPIPFKCQ